VSASGIAPVDAALAAALGDRLDGRVTIAFQNGQPMRVSGLDVTGAGLHLTADGTVQGFTGGYPVQGKARLVSDDISRFAGLAGRPLSVAADIAVSGSGALLGGAFDIDLQAVTTDLETGQARIDPLLTGQSTLALKARRDTTGTTLRDFTLKNAALSADASGAIDSQAGNLTLSARLAELSLVEPSLSGPATLDTNATWTAGKPVQVQSLTVAGAGAQLKASGTLDPSDDTLPITGKADLSAKDLSRFSTLSRRPLRGALSLSASGSGAVKGGDFDVTLSASGQDLGAGLGDIDKLIAGQSTLTLDAARKDGRIRITDFALETPQLTAQAAGGLDETRKLDFSAKLADLGVLVPDFPGPLTATGNARADGADWQVALDATGPGGTTARVEGRVAGSGKDVNLSLTGAAPLGLANSFIAPRSIRGSARYDLRMNGAPGLAALSGTVSANGAQIAAPTLGVALNGVDATAQLSGGRADLSVAARVEGGGQVSVEGPVSLSPPFDAGLRVTLNNAAFRDPELYQTRVSGDISLQGPLRGAGQVTGTLELGTTEIQVPSAGAAPGGLV
ncbi:MAG: translocation/assembly module TamB domain-containing protein, partial [Paracoccaceae bacterium]